MKNQSKIIDRIMKNDPNGLLNDSDEMDSLFTLKYVSKSIRTTTRKKAIYIARRKPCLDFHRFEHKFLQCEKDIKNGKKILVPYSKRPRIEADSFFTIRGLMLYVACFQQINNRTRLRIILWNKTESDLLLRSLKKILHEDGRSIISI